MIFHGFKTVFTANTDHTNRTCGEGASAIWHYTDGTDPDMPSDAALLHVRHNFK